MSKFVWIDSVEPAESRITGERMRELCEEEPEIRASRLTVEIKAEFGVELHEGAATDIGEWRALQG